jgi:hypothetical protein
MTVADDRLWHEPADPGCSLNWVIAGQHLLVLSITGFDLSGLRHARGPPLFRTIQVCPKDRLTFPPAGS